MCVSGRTSGRTSLRINASAGGPQYEGKRDEDLYLPTDDVSDAQAELIGRGVNRKLRLPPEQEDARRRHLELDRQHGHRLPQRPGLETQGGVSRELATGQGAVM